ncbi:uncharacterized protein LOC113146611 [Cyclospora cayetanensis]|uniref:Uncharacterized protein LOC113146611 n=1 Tax=Cyclospora cayetanensis TaxID=88456 RepID=A0A6P6RR85_9EIME|nr:uncharacterized protein LOC113146611 [Cyclospora cayetanensis]
MLTFHQGATTSLNAALTGSPDFQIRIHAPVEDTKDTLASLDSLLKLEEAERRMDEEDYAAEKQRMLNLHKNRIRDLVFAAFEPLHGMVRPAIRVHTTVPGRVPTFYWFRILIAYFRVPQIPNPITTEAIEGMRNLSEF